MLKWCARFCTVKRVMQGTVCLMLMLPVMNNALAESVRQGENIALLQGSEWLQHQPKNHFTLQLLATRNSAGLREFAKKQGFPAPLAHLVVELKGKEMHLLVQGSYATQAEAERAAKHLPGGIRPWIRSLGSIQQVAMSEAPPVAKAAAVSVEEGGIKEMPWLWSQDPQAYTIQLAAAENREAVENVMRQLVLPGERMVVRTQRNNGPWYLLIYGSFTDEASASATIGRLPKAQQKAKPWPRRFASLHDEISQAMP